MTDYAYDWTPAALFRGSNGAALPDADEREFAASMSERQAAALAVFESRGWCDHSGALTPEGRAVFEYGERHRAGMEDTLRAFGNTLSDIEMAERMRRMRIAPQAQVINNSIVITGPTHNPAVADAAARMRVAQAREDKVR